MAGINNPFNPANVPPEQYRQPEKVTENPTKLDHRGFDAKKIAFSGKLGTLGYQILEDYKKAGQVTSLDWKAEQFTAKSPRHAHFKTKVAIT